MNRWQNSKEIQRTRKIDRAQRHYTPAERVWLENYNAQLCRWQSRQKAQRKIRCSLMKMTRALEGKSKHLCWHNIFYQSVKRNQLLAVKSDPFEELFLSTWTGFVSTLNQVFEWNYKTVCLFKIALFTVNFSHLHHKTIYHLCEAISCYFIVLYSIAC